VSGREPDDELELGQRAAKEIDQENTHGGRWAAAEVAGRAVEGGND
jgi:hypothetical protein